MAASISAAQTPASQPGASLSRKTLAAAALACMSLAACVTRPAPLPTPSPAPGPAQPPRSGPSPFPDAPPTPVGASPAALPGWSEEDHLAAFQAYVAGCGAARDPAARSTCGQARAMAGRRISPSDARRFFEERFFVSPAETNDGRPGLLTSYFAPEYAARRRPDAEFDAPVLAAPASPRSAGDRSVIEAAARPGEALAWMRAEDLFFLQIQGSGYLTFEDGGKARAAYAADNGKPFVGIARPMAERGLLPPNGTSGDAIRGWLAQHRGAEARAVMALNPRYIFFRLDPDNGGDPAGAAGIPLTARRAIAVDPAHWSYGDLVWVNADGGNLRGASASYRGLVVALDTGSAIKGPVRADLYMGRGAVAGAEAGTVRHPLRMWRLVPRG
jgi:membrane-bound lytic murein transglycosylase A